MLFSGVHPAVLTPFGEERELRVDALADAVDWLIDSGVDGIVGLGTLAEFRSLSTDERLVGAHNRHRVRRRPGAGHDRHRRGDGRGSGGAG